MSALRVWSACTLALILAGVSGDRLSADDRIASASAPRAARATAIPDPLRHFALFGWVSPPVESTNAARFDELSQLALNVALPAWLDSGRLVANQQRMGLAAPRGVRCLAWDNRLEGLDFNDPGSPAILDSVVADYRSDPGFFGYYFTDEPQPAESPRLARYYAELASRDPAHPSFDNLIGRGGFSTRAEWESYVRQFADTVHPTVLCDALYDFLVGSDRGLFVENAAGLRALADEYGIPFWGIVLLVQHGSYRDLTPGELRWQVSMLLAYGARGVGYFTYWTPAPDPVWNWQPAVIGYDGVRSRWYTVLQGFNPSVRAAGETLASLAWISTQHAGSQPVGGAAFARDGWIASVAGRAAIGRFKGDPTSRFVLVVNADSSGAQTIALSFAQPVRVSRLGDAADIWSPLPTEPDGANGRVSLFLSSGDFALLRLDSNLDAPPVGPRLTVGPNPACCAVRLAVTRLGSRAHLEILDSAGRRVWARDLEQDDTVLVWRGERDGGGTVRPGIYHVRVRDSLGQASARVSWVGR